MLDYTPPLSSGNSPSAYPLCEGPALTPTAVPTSALITSLDTCARSSTEGIGRYRLADLLSQAGLHKEAANVRECSREYIVVGCEKCDRIEGHPVPKFSCHHRLCGECSRRRQSRALGRLYPAFQHFRRLYPQDRIVQLTLTVKSSHEELKDIITRFKSAFRRFRKTKLWRERIRAGVGGYEITYNPEDGKGWHFHCHLLLFRKWWWSHREIKEAWQLSTRGEGSVVYIEDKNLKLGKALRETIKYPYKPASLKYFTPDLVRQVSSLKRIKFSETYGLLRGLQVEDDSDGDLEEPLLRAGDSCPGCGGKLSLVVLSRIRVEALIKEREKEGSKSCHGPPDG